MATRSGEGAAPVERAVAHPVQSLGPAIIGLGYAGRAVVRIDAIAEPGAGLEIDQVAVAAERVAIEPLPAPAD